MIKTKTTANINGKKSRKGSWLQNLFQNIKKNLSRKKPAGLLHI